MKATQVFSPGYICAAFKNQVSNFLTKDWEGRGGREDETIAGKKSGSLRAKQGMRGFKQLEGNSAFLISDEHDPGEQINKLLRV